MIATSVGNITADLGEEAGRADVRGAAMLVPHGEERIFARLEP
jgi:hypothetical protein